MGSACPPNCWCFHLEHARIQRRLSINLRISKYALTDIPALSMFRVEGEVPR
jgi:hypothetical protein